MTPLLYITAIIPVNKKKFVSSISASEYGFLIKNLALQALGTTVSSSRGGDLSVLLLLSGMATTNPTVL
jgi:hypothetical protein